MLFYGLKKDGKLTWNNKKLLDQFIKNLPNCKVEMNIKRYRKKRSDQQNKLYWVWLTYIAADTGFTTDELHASFRAMFLTDRTQRIPIVRSTTVLNILEFMTYLKKVEREANELRIILPNPEDYWTEQEVKAYRKI